ncbi:MAG TPA: HAMP domain-containing sensor histidine kinase, partial [Patescibacteria group bacterium]|nr:HAMP domain-containing sensor histidine kinase [Patescibacteria group bacterium]
MSGVLVGTRFAFFLTLSLVFVISCLSLLQIQGFYLVSTSWRNEQNTFADTIILNSMLVVIAVVAWLSNRETERSLQRARASEVELKKERNLLEIKVEERTKELRQAQLEKVTQLYRFAEVGRLSSSLFHDLVTPLSLISLNLEELNNKHQQEKIADMRALLRRAIQGTKYLETAIKTVRKQLQNQDAKRIFSLNKEIKHILKLVQHKMRGMNIKMVFSSTDEIKIYGSDIKFSQLITNLLLNAIDSYENFSGEKSKREIIITLNRQKKMIVFTITDFGKGIMKED